MCGLFLPLSELLLHLWCGGMFCFLERVEQVLVALQTHHVVLSHSHHLQVVRGYASQTATTHRQHTQAAPDGFSFICLNDDDDDDGDDDDDDDDF